jgi:FkbM family methyltransferase
MSLDKTLQIQIGDQFHTLTSDDDYLTQLGQHFEPHMCKLFLALLEKNHVVLDIGANIGCTTILFAQNAREVISFEPSPTTFKYLQLNIRRANFRNVQLHNVGLGTQDEDLTLTFAATNRAGAFVSNQTPASAGHIVENIHIKRGDSYIKSTRVDFIKIDVEGFERDVLRGLTDTIRRNRPTVVSELNHWCLNAFQRISIPDYFDYLLSVFPILYAVDGDTYLDLHDANHRYSVMYHHILHFKYPNLVGAFDSAQLARMLLDFHQ